MHKHNKSLQTSEEVLQSMLRKHNKYLDGFKSHKSHKQQNILKKENTHSLLTADDILFMSRYESMMKNSGSFIKTVHESSKRKAAQ